MKKTLMTLTLVLTLTGLLLGGTSTPADAEVYHLQGMDYAGTGISYVILDTAQDTALVFHKIFGPPSFTHFKYVTYNVQGSHAMKFDVYSSTQVTITNSEELWLDIAPMGVFGMDKLGAILIKFGDSVYPNKQIFSLLHLIASW